MVTHKILQDNFSILSMDIQTENKLTFFFGVDSLNKDEVDQWNPADLGKVEFVSDFDLSSAEN